MTLNPPVNSRSDKELFNIVSNNKKWTQQARDEAYTELLARNYPSNEIIQRIQHNKELIESYETKVKNEREENRTMGYHPLHALAILLFFPLTLIIPGNLLRPYWHLDKYNYNRRITQRIILSIMSIILWITIAQMIF